MATPMLDRLVEEQNKVWKRMLDIRDAAEGEKRDMSAEERANWDLAEARLNEVSADIERLERLASLEKIDRDQIIPTAGGGPAGADDEAYRAAFAAYVRGGMERLTVDQRDLLMGMHVDLRAGSSQVDPAGGFLVPEGFRNLMTETMKAYGGLLAIANVIETDNGQDLPWVNNDDTGNEGEILGENTEVGDQDFSWTGRKLKAHIFSSKKTRLPIALLQDAAFNLDEWLPRKLGERIGRRSARAWITGTGDDEPLGIVTGVAVGKQGTTGQTTSIIYDDLIDLEHSVDPAYRINARYVLGDQMLKVIRKLKDSQNRPLWTPVPTAGMPAQINGWGYTIDNSMPVPAASAKTIVFGDIKAGYVIRRVRGVQNMRLSERYAEFLQVAFLAFARMDGMIDDSSAIRAYQHAAS